MAGAMRAGPDADGGDAQALGDPGGELGGDAFEHERKAARLLQPTRVFQDPEGVVGCPALHLEAAHGMYALRRQAQVPHHRDLAIHQRADHVQALGAALQLHRGSAAL